MQRDVQHSVQMKMHRKHGHQHWQIMPTLIISCVLWIWLSCPAVSSLALKCKTRVKRSDSACQPISSKTWMSRRWGAGRPRFTPDVTHRFHRKGTITEIICRALSIQQEEVGEGLGAGGERKGGEGGAELYSLQIMRKEWIQLGFLILPDCD